VALSILFGLGILHYSGRQAGLEFFTGYLIEKALSVDNLFLFWLFSAPLRSTNVSNTACSNGAFWAL